MGEKQLFAKLSVCALLGLNVGGYYVFWPHAEGTPATEVLEPKNRDGEIRIRPSADDKPKELPSKVTAAPNPIEFPPLSTTNATDEGSTEALRRLLDHIKKETDDGNVSPSPSPDKTIIPANNATALEPRPLPPLQANPLAPDPKVGITSPLTPKGPPSSWSLRTDIAGKQTMLIARSRLHDILEFTVLCDRTNPRSETEDVIALGNVIVVGDGITVRCQKLTLPLSQTRLIFEGDVTVMTHKSGVLRGERFVWELSSAPAPGNTNPLSKPGALGAPR